MVTVLVGLGAVALLAGIQLGGNQTGQPSFETGPMPVTAENDPAVLVTNEPIVRAQQFGDWTVRLSDEQSRHGDAVRCTSGEADHARVRGDRCGLYICVA